MIRRSLCLLAAALALSSCASRTEMGYRAYSVGHYDKAYDRWQAMANAGDATALNNLAVMWRDGQVPGQPASIEKAAQYFLLAAQHGYVPAMYSIAVYQLNQGQGDAAFSWLNMAARWGNQDAILTLQQMKAPIPAPDLAIAQQQRTIQQEAVQSANAAALGQVIGCAIGGGCRSASYVPRPAASDPAPAPQPARTTTCRAQILPDVMGHPVYQCR